jgi:hypothetical protein
MGQSSQPPPQRQHTQLVVSTRLNLISRVFTSQGCRFCYSSVRIIHTVQRCFKALLLTSRSASLSQLWGSTPLSTFGGTVTRTTTGEESGKGILPDGGRFSVSDGGATGFVRVSNDDVFCMTP